jgi:hypothetical protein
MNTSAIHASDDFSRPEVACEAFIDGSAAQCFQYFKRALFFWNAPMPLYGAIEKYFEDIIFDFHGVLLSNIDLSGAKIAQAVKTVCSNLHTRSIQITDVN